MQMSHEEAAFETATGKWAKELGYTKVEFLSKKSITEDIIHVKFTK